MIEELEVSQDVVAQARAVLAQRIEGIYVDRKQIDAAWMLVLDTGEDGRINSGAEQALNRLGIERCPKAPDGCGGTGLLLGDTCHDCYGHGWKIGGSDD